MRPICENSRNPCLAGRQVWHWRFLQGNLLTCFLVLICSPSFAQVQHYDYKRKLDGIKDPWHTIILPDEVFAKLNSGLSDIRIYGFTENKDTLEAPYLLQLAREQVTEKEVAFNLINQSKNDKGYYFTFEVPVQSAVNQMHLDFNQSNFDWKLNLEGSHDQKVWYTVIEDYRILSIQADLLHYSFTKVVFPDTKYKYFRLLIKSKEKPELVTAALSLNEVVEGIVKKYPVQSSVIKDDKKSKETIVDLNLNAAVPVSSIKIHVNEKFDYYRSLTIQYLHDSIKTASGWKYNYNTLGNGILTSIEKNEFRLNSTTVKKIRVIIENQDNQPLHIDSVEVQGYVHELIARFTKPADYYLVYSSRQSTSPNYDIDRFRDKIPAALSPLQVREEQVIEKVVVAKAETEPLFKNKMYLWAIMVAIITALGGFTVSMMRKK